MRLDKFALAALACLAACAPTPPRIAASSCQLAIDAVLPVTYIDRRIPVVNVKIFGQNMRMLVDTGAAGSLISPGAYNRLHINRTVNPSGDYAVGLGGNVEISAFTLVDVDVGSVKLRDDVVAILSRPEPEETGPDAIDGIMGYDLLQNFDIALDLPHNRISLYTPQHCTIGETPWAGDYAPLPFTRPQDGGPAITETIDGSRFNVVIDTGALHSLIMQGSLQRNGVIPENEPVTLQSMGTGIGGRTFRMTRARFSTLGIGAEVFSNAVLALDSTAEADLNIDTDGLLGEDYFANHRVFIANSTNTAYLGLSGK